MRGRYSIHDERGTILEFREYPRRVFETLINKIRARIREKVPEFRGDIL